jgi:hypothetical protein
LPAFFAPPAEGVSGVSGVSPQKAERRGAKMQQFEKQEQKQESEKEEKWQEDGDRGGGGDGGGGGGGGGEGQSAVEQGTGVFDSDTWARTFVERGGLRHLVKVLLSNQFLPAPARTDAKEPAGPPGPQGPPGPPGPPPLTSPVQQQIPPLECLSLLVKV